MSTRVSLAAELALTAARLRLLAEALPDPDTPAIVEEWASFLEEIDAARSLGTAELILIEFRAGIDAPAPATGT